MEFPVFKSPFNRFDDPERKAIRRKTNRNCNKPKCNTGGSTNAISVGKISMHLRSSADEPMDNLLQNHQNAEMIGTYPSAGSETISEIEEDGNTSDRDNTGPETKTDIDTSMTGLGFARIIRGVDILPVIVEEENLSADEFDGKCCEIPQTSRDTTSWLDIIHNFHPLLITSDGKVKNLIANHVQVMKITRPTRVCKLSTYFKRDLPRKLYNSFYIDNQGVDEDRLPHPVQEDLYKYRLTFAMTVTSSGKENAIPNVSDYLTEHKNTKAGFQQVVKICRLCGERCRRFVAKNHNAVIKMIAVYMPLVVRENNTFLIGLCEGCDSNLAKIANFMFKFLDHDKMITERYQCFLCMRSGNILLVHANKATMAKLAEGFSGIYCKLAPMYEGPQYMCKQCGLILTLYEKMQNLLRKTNLVFANPDERFYTNRFIPKPLAIQFRFPDECIDRTRRLITYKRCTANDDTFFNVNLLDLNKFRRYSVPKQTLADKKKRLKRKSKIAVPQEDTISAGATESRILAVYEVQMSALSPQTLEHRPPKHTVKRRAHVIKFLPSYEHISSDEED